MAFRAASPASISEDLRESGPSSMSDHAETVARPRTATTSNACVASSTLARVSQFRGLVMSDPAASPRSSSRVRRASTTTSRSRGGKHRTRTRAGPEEESPRPKEESFSFSFSPPTAASTSDASFARNASSSASASSPTTEASAKRTPPPFVPECPLLSFLSPSVHRFLSSPVTYARLILAARCEFAARIRAALATPRPPAVTRTSASPFRERSALAAPTTASGPRSSRHRDTTRSLMPTSTWSAM
mmetsp:Transcript_15485/g.60601  ORF Transcript_15485/g.60601 Transcript_15485/m.60601 type:complete len:246 (+) Transcript_15485:1060-1797(+)